MVSRPAPGACTWQPSPGTVLSARCPRCRHGAVLHIGCEKCPVCLLLLLAAVYARRARVNLDGLPADP